MLTCAQDIIRLICRLSSLASRKLGTSRQDQADWCARPLLVSSEKNVMCLLINNTARTMSK